MKSVRLKRLGGFTIVEVLVVLAISGALLASSLALVANLQPEADFTQSMYDMKSKIENSIRGASNTNYPNTTQFDCIKSANKPTLVSVIAPATHEPGTNQDCIFLGKALAIPLNAGTLYIYSILGLRTDASGNNITTYEAATPTVANTSGFDLTETYSRNNTSIRLLSAKADSYSGTRALAGFYGNLSKGSNTYGGQAGSSFYSKSYAYTSGNPQTCIQEPGSTCTPQQLNRWDLCFDDYSGKQKALLSIINSGAGATTVLRINQQCS